MSVRLKKAVWHERVVVKGKYLYTRHHKAVVVHLGHHPNDLILRLDNEGWDCVVPYWEVEFL